MAAGDISHGRMASALVRHVAACCGLAALLASCQSADIERLRLAPRGADYASYEWGDPHWTLSVQNPRPGEPAESFPEPPLVVTRKRDMATCSIDGGIWSKDHFYKQADRPVVVLLESSGSNEWLALYSLETCQKLREIDVTGHKWKVTPRGRIVTEDERGRRVLGNVEGS